MGTQDQARVLIIGGGLGGLSLAQGLKQAGVPFHIYERDTSASYRAQGYRIRIWGNSLRRLLPQHLFHAFEATCGQIVQFGHPINALTGEAARTTSPPPPSRPLVGGAPDVPDKPYNADRAVLRDVLLSGLEEHISFSKRLVRYDIHEGPDEDVVIAHFTDGTSERGAFLIGADGVRSHVRRQLLPHMNILDTEGRAVFGKTPLTEKARATLPGKLFDGICLIGEKIGSKMNLFTDMMTFDHEESCTVGKNLKLHVPHDYLYWVLVFRKDCLPVDEEHTLHLLTRNQSAQKALDLTPKWNEDIRAIFSLQQRDAASTLLFLTAMPDFATTWATIADAAKGRVTLIGDAAHPMPPVGGVGANAAFQDSVELCEALTAIYDVHSQADRVASLVDYEKRMCERSQEMVAKSSQGGTNLFGMKPIEELQPFVF